jgi:hypothetical protein
MRAVPQVKLQYQEWQSIGDVYIDIELSDLFKASKTAQVSFI